MKILLINYRYFLSGGPEKYMFEVKELLESHGHEVIPFSVESQKNVSTNYDIYFAHPIGGDGKTYFEEYEKDIKTILQILERQFYSIPVRKELERLIQDTKPDICYLLHHYNKLSPSVIDACKKKNIPVVMRLSDFFLVCPNALLLRNSHVCEECVNGTLFSAIRHKCVKHSYLSSLIKVFAMYFHRLIGVYRRVNYVVSPSNFTIRKIRQKIEYLKFINIPTFVEIEERHNPIKGKYALVVARIEAEKGIMTAVKAFQGTKYILKIVGKSNIDYDKYVREYINKNKVTNVELMGEKHGKELQSIYRNSRLVIIPSECYENMPNVALEAMSYSKPIIASNLGSLKEMVKNNHNGLLFEPTNFLELRKKIELLFEDDALVERLGKNAYQEAITKYNPGKHYEALVDIFDKAISEEERWKRR